MENIEIEHVLFKGIKINDVGMRDIYEIIRNNRHHKGYVCLNDVSNIMAAAKDKEMSDSINQSLLSISDGTPLPWYGRLVGCKRIERIAGFELMSHIMEDCNGFKHYLLGDTEQTINRVIAKARNANSNLKIAGYSPPFKAKFSEEDNEIIFDKINREDPDIIWVSFGAWKQEKWMHQNLRRLNRGIMAGVGAAFKYYIGDLYMPPKFIQKLGLQWLFRIMTSKPSRKTFTTLRFRTKFAFHFPFEVIKGRR